jgi:hypothetical protein
MSPLRGPSVHRAAAFPRRVAGAVGSQAARRAQSASALRRRQGGGQGRAMVGTSVAVPAPRQRCTDGARHDRGPAGLALALALRPVGWCGAPGAPPPRRDARARLGRPATRATAPDPAPSANHAPDLRGRHLLRLKGLVGVEPVADALVDPVGNSPRHRIEMGGAELAREVEGGSSHSPSVSWSGHPRKAGSPLAGSRRTELHRMRMTLRTVGSIRSRRFRVTRWQRARRRGMLDHERALPREQIPDPGQGLRAVVKRAEGPDPAQLPVRVTALPGVGRDQGWA